MPSIDLHWIDLAVIGLFFVATVGVGWWASTRASRNLKSYFLGGNEIPWYALGLSNASGMFDISGTMLMVGWLFIYGLKSVWVPWLWPVFNQVILMVYLAVWLRRSNVLTGAEWIRFRFGDRSGAKAAHAVVVLFALITVIAFLAYGFIGVGKFAAYLAGDAWQLAETDAANAKLYGLLITFITAAYVVKGGMYSVVFTEVMQFFIMTVACVWVGVIAIQAVSPEMIAAAVPDGWNKLIFGWELGLDWSEKMPAAAAKVQSDGWELFTVFVGIIFVKGLLASAAGPTPNYDMQRVLSARTPKEAAMMSGFVSVVLLIPRYMLITGLTVLALVHFTGQIESAQGGMDFDSILPLAMRDFMPVGLLGLLIAAMMAAFMSTYAATVNAAPAYVVNDIYKRYLKPEATDKECVRLSYAMSITVVVVGTAVGFYVDQIGNLVNWIVLALYGGYVASNVLKWHWWRFNGWGYFWGMITGILAALVVAILYSTSLQDVTTFYGIEKNLAVFPLILGLSALGCVAGSLASAPDDPEVLKEFYRRVRPWGAWKPVREMLEQDDPSIQPNREFGRDAINVLVGIAWQTGLTAIGIYLVLQDYRSLGLAVLVVLATSVFLKFNWFDRLSNEPA